MKRFFPSSRKGYTAGGNALMRVEALFLPGREHVIEAKESEDEEQDESGDPPTTSKSTHNSFSKHFTAEIAER